MGGEAGGDLLGEEEVIAGGHHAVHTGQAGGAVVGVQLVALPGIVAQHHVGADRRTQAHTRPRSAREYSSSPSG